MEYHAFDPSWKNGYRNDRLYKFNDYYQNQEIKPDLVVARHTLEHQDNVKGFIK